MLNAPPLYVRWNNKANATPIKSIELDEENNRAYLDIDLVEPEADGEFVRVGD